MEGKSAAYTRFMEEEKGRRYTIPNYVEANGNRILERDIAALVGAVPGDSYIDSLEIEAYNATPGYVVKRLEEMGHEWTETSEDELREMIDYVTVNNSPMGLREMFLSSTDTVAVMAALSVSGKSALDTLHDLSESFTVNDEDGLDNESLRADGLVFTVSLSDLYLFKRASYVGAAQDLSISEFTFLTSGGEYIVSEADARPSTWGGGLMYRQEDMRHVEDLELAELV